MHLCAQLSTHRHLAAGAGCIDCAQFLIDAGSDVSAEGPARMQPIHEAVGNPAMVRLLLARGGDPNAKNHRRVTPLHLAASMRHKDMDQRSVADHAETARLLLDAGADIDARDATRETPLFRAVTDERKLGLVELLVERGANTALTGKQGRNLAAAIRGASIREFLGM